MSGSNRAKPREGAQRPDGGRLATSGEAWGPNRARRPPENVAKLTVYIQPGGPGPASAPAGVQGREEATLARTRSSPRVLGGPRREAEPKCHRDFVTQPARILLYPCTCQERRSVQRDAWNDCLVVLSADSLPVSPAEAMPKAFGLCRAAAVQLQQPGTHTYPAVLVPSSPAAQIGRSTRSSHSPHSLCCCSPKASNKRGHKFVASLQADRRNDALRSSDAAAPADAALQRASGRTPTTAPQSAAHARRRARTPTKGAPHAR